MGVSKLLKQRCLLNAKIFCAVHDYVGKADLSKGYFNPKRKLGLTYIHRY